MKEKLFYFPFYPADWLADTSVLSLEEKGAYITLISTMYLQEDCSVFKRHIQNILGIQDKRRFDRIMTNIYPLLIDNGEKVTQKRIKQIKVKIANTVNKKSEAGKAGAKQRWSKKPQVYVNKKIDKFSDVSAMDKARKALNNNYE